MSNLQCRLTVGNNGNVKKVAGLTADNSALYNSALSYAKDQDAALKLWGVAYSAPFIEYFGDWKGQKEILSNPSGEPSLDDVLHFLQLKRAEKQTITKNDVREIRSMADELAVESPSVLYNKLYSLFYPDGRFDASEQRLVDSGIYTQSEARAIANDNAAQKRIKSMLDKMQAAELLPSDNDKLGSFSTSTTPALVGKIYNPVKNSFGKYITENPAIVESVLAKQLGGITDETAFKEAVYSLPYRQVIERYENDAAFATDLYNHYSAYTQVPIIVLEADGQVTRQTTRTFLDTRITNAHIATADDSYKNNLSQEIDLLTSLGDYTWRNESDKIERLLYRVAANAANIGLDLTNLPAMYDIKSMEEIQDFLGATDVFIANDSIETTAAYQDAYAAFFGIKTEVLTDNRTLPKRLQGLAIVSAADEFSNSFYFEDYGLIPLGDNLFHKVDTSTPNDTLYNALYSLAVNDPSMLPKEAYHKVVFKDGTLDRSKLSNARNKEAVISGIKSYVQKQVARYEQSYNRGNLEKLVLYKTVFGHPINMEYGVDVESEAAKYAYLKGEKIAVDGTVYQAAAMDFYITMLKEKLKNSDLYKNVLAHFDIENRTMLSGEIILQHDDPKTKRDIDALMPKGKLRQELIKYVAASRHPSLSGLFEDEIKNAVGKETLSETLKSSEFRQWLYSKHPELLPKFKGVYTKNESNFNIIEAANTFDEFIRLDEGVYMRVSENGQGSLYTRSYVSPYFDAAPANLTRVNDYTTPNNGNVVTANHTYDKSDLKALAKKHEC
jgi:hypothetical protein